VTADDVDGLRRLALGYAAAVDTLDGASFADLFTPDGELWVPRPGGDGTPTIRRAGRARLAAIPTALAGYHATYHAVLAADYDVADGTATGEVVGVAHHLATDPGTAGPGGLDTVWYLRYVDRYVRVGGRWLLTRRALHRRGIEERRIAHVGPGRA
jgi:hypothetical protein